MKKKIIALFMGAAMIFSLAGCSSLSSLSTKQATVGDVVEVAWFDMTVKSVTKVDTYGTYTATEGNVLVDVVISLTNTFGEELPFWNEEFYLDDPADQEYYDLPFAQEEVGSEDLMPTEFALGVNQTVEYHLIYEVPTTSTNLALEYEEYYEDETTGKTFSISLGI